MNSPSPDEMAAVVAHPSPNNMPGSGKRYRPAPAKTFQCRGYGECRMVFSRSEHLARHIRKHTGERPFACHCSKQFSRLDNLRQHAQTVHADKQDQNERMMRDLTTLHANMAAANKVGSGRGGRRHQPMTVKQEEAAPVMHQRPGTSTGYEGDLVYPNNYETSSRQASNHSFREPGQSFLVPPQQSSQSFLGYSVANSSGSESGGTNTSRPTTATGAADSGKQPRSLPPLSAVVSASISSSQQFPFPSNVRRPSTATRPGTAPASASLFSSKSSFLDRAGMGLGNRTELPLHFGRPSSSHFGSELSQQLQLGYDSLDFSSTHDASPFSFHPPEPAASPSAPNPRKRPFTADDESHESYEYGSESRPQSRRLSVMELCNDDNTPPSRSGPGSFLLSASRPTTSSGLVSSTQTLHIFDHSQSPPPLFARTPSSAAGPIGGPASTEFRGGSRVLRPTLPSSSPTSSSSSTPPASATISSPTLLSSAFRPPPFSTAPASAAAVAAAAAAASQQQQFPHSPTFSTTSTTSSLASYSPRSPPSGSSSPIYDGSRLVHGRTRGHGGEQSQQSNGQVRISLSPNPSAAFGMRV